MPKTRVPFWEAKFAGTVARDIRQREALIAAGWRVLTVWECETRDRKVLSERLKLELPRDSQGLHGARLVRVAVCPCYDRM